MPPGTLPPPRFLSASRSLGLALLHGGDDDGHGFDPAKSRPLGNGLQNMRSRLEAVEGRRRSRASPGRGTRVTFLTVPAGKRADRHANAAAISSAPPG